MAEMGETVSSESLSSKEKVEYLEKFIVKGGKFITKKQYQKAIDYFGSGEMANKVGIDFRNDAVSITWSSTLQSEDIQRIADSLAPVCRLDLDPPYFNSYFQRSVSIVLGYPYALRRGGCH